MAGKSGGGLSFKNALIIFLLAAAIRILYAGLFALAGGDDYFRWTAAAVQREAAQLRSLATPAFSDIALRTVRGIGAAPAAGSQALGQRGRTRFNRMRPAMIVTAQHVTLRVYTVICTLPIGLVATFIGVTQGLMTRARRRYMAKKESAIIYERARMCLWLPPLAFMLYLCLPVQMPFYPLAMLAWLVWGGTVWLSIGWFAKHL